MKKNIGTCAFLSAAALILVLAGCPAGGTSLGSSGEWEEERLEWDDDPYLFRRFPNLAPGQRLTREYFDANNAPVSEWNRRGHNHRHPDPFTFADGTPVTNLDDWRERREEISLIIQYYMHGWKPALDPETVEIGWTDAGNSTDIGIRHIPSGRTHSFTVSHTPPANAAAGNAVLLFGFGFPPSRPGSGWGTAAFSSGWATSGTLFSASRAGPVATLFGLSPGHADTPSAFMSSAWIMSVILTVIEEGGLGGFYHPERVGITGFSRNGKEAMVMGAFAQGRGGSRIGQTFVHQAGSGGPTVERFLAQIAYRNLTRDPLPVDGVGAESYDELSSIVWFLGRGDNPAAGEESRRAVRGWTRDTPGIPPGSVIYGESVLQRIWPFYKPSGPCHAPGGGGHPEGGRGDWGGIQTLAQARQEQSAWFSARFGQFTNMHAGLSLDFNYDGPGTRRYGILCTMPFDAHFIAALIVPRVILFSEGFGMGNVRNNPEGTWANWLMVDEVYQMYAEALGDPSIIWRNAIVMYNIPHATRPYLNQDEVDLANAILGGQTPHARFRTPPFPVDDPRYRWEFNRMDWGRPGSSTIAERVYRMRQSRVRAMDHRGLLEHPEPLN